MVTISVTIWISAAPQQVLTLLSRHFPKEPRLHCPIIGNEVALGGIALALGIIFHPYFPPESFIF